MADARESVFDLCGTFVNLEDGGGAQPLEVTADFWSRLMSGELRVDRLTGAIDMTTDSPGWEMHPEGEELLLMLSGAMDLLLEEPAGERSVALGEGAAFIVPRGVWHRQVLREPGRLFFITAGAGTQHRPV